MSSRWGSSRPRAHRAGTASEDASSPRRTSRWRVSGAEVEGDHHRTSRRQWARDIEKHTAYVALGFEVVRLTSAHIRPTGSAAVTLVGGALRRRGWSPPR
ncbi:hypothetical protein [Microbacterium arborescens]|uniref:hypothetical protein n=1 Tax=Microbacterium arborescens TaxID=33883 RepID=UPI003C71324F